MLQCQILLKSFLDILNLGASQPLFLMPYEYYESFFHIYRQGVFFSSCQYDASTTKFSLMADKVSHTHTLSNLFIALHDCDPVLLKIF